MHYGQTVGEGAGGAGGGGGWLVDAVRGLRYDYGREAARAPGNTDGVIAAADGGLFRAMGEALGWEVEK